MRPSSMPLSLTPKMLEWHPDLVRWIAATGQVVVDSRDADHETGVIALADQTARPRSGRPPDARCLV